MIFYSSSIDVILKENTRPQLIDNMYVSQSLYKGVPVFHLWILSLGHFRYFSYKLNRNDFIFQNLSNIICQQAKKIERRAALKEHC